MRSALRRAAAFAAGALAVLVAPGIASAATVSLWHMDEGSSASVMADSIGSNDGSLGDVTSGLPGFAGLAYGFNGATSIVRVGGSSGLNPGTKAFAITAHVKFPARPSATVADYDLIRKGLSSETGGFYKMEILAGGGAFCSMGNPDTGQSDSITAGPDLSDNQWHEITCVRQGRTLSVVVDGHIYGKAADTGDISNSATVTVGAKVSSQGIADQYGGIMDEVSFSTEGATSESPPVVSGTPMVGSTLQAGTGAWDAAPVPAPTFSYQWERCTGPSCTSIAGATGSAYTAQGADAGATLRVAVTATSLGKPAMAFSAETALVRDAPPPVVRFGTLVAAMPPPAAAVAPVQQPVSGTGTGTGTCAALRATWIRRSVDWSRGGRSTLRFDVARRTAALHATRGAVSTVRFTLDGRTVGPRSDVRRAILRRGALTPGTHVLRAIVKPRHGRSRTLAVRLTVGPC
jgi:hypothetical protein